MTVTLRKLTAIHGKFVYNLLEVLIQGFIVLGEHCSLAGCGLLAVELVLELRLFVIGAALATRLDIFYSPLRL